MKSKNKNPYYQQHPSQDYDRDERFVDRRFSMAGVRFKNGAEEERRFKPDQEREHHAHGYDDYYRKIDSWDDDADWKSLRSGDNLSRYGEKIPGHRDWSNDSRSEAFSEKKFRGKGPKGYQRSDESIHEEACHLLWESPQVDASDVEVTVANGIIYLKGEVKDRQEKRQAESLLDHISGVTDVQNELKLKRAIDGWVAGVSSVSEEENQKGMDAIKGLKLS